MPKSTLIDSNVLIDVWGPRGATSDWSSAALAACSAAGPLLINTIVWSELAPAVDEEVVLETISGELGIAQEAIPWSAAFLAGRTHSRYRRAGGARERTLPDFFIGAHASVTGYRILTRDPGRYRRHRGRSAPGALARAQHALARLAD